MIRILHSVSNMDRAGIETMLMNYYRHIDRKEVQFDFLCNKKKPGAYDEEIRSLGGKIYHTPGLNPFKYLTYLKYMKKFFLENDCYRIVHAHNGAFVVYPLFAAKVNGIENRISHVHSASFTVDYKWPLKIFCKRFISLVTTNKWACGKVAAKFYYGDKAVLKGETKVINNAIEVERFIYNPEKREELRRKYNLENNIVIGHAGRFSSQKNHTFLIDIFDEIRKINPNTRLVLLGDGELEDTIKEKVQRLNLTEYVLFLGNVKNVNEWYQAFDVFVLPSIWEGLPVVGVEAQAADLPCVFSEDITDEIKIISKTKFLNRDLEKVKWAQEILESAKIKERKDQREVIKDAGYDIRYEAEKLVMLYKQMIKI